MISVLSLCLKVHLRMKYNMTERTKIPALNDEGKFIYDEHSPLTDDGKRYEHYLDTTQDVFPKTFEEFIKAGM